MVRVFFLRREYAPQHFQFDVRRGRGHASEGIINMSAIIL